MIKKLIAVLMTLSLLFAACAASADMEIPEWKDMPMAVMEDDETQIDEAAFAGEWVLKVAFAGTDYVSEASLFDDYGINFMPYIIGDGLIKQDYQQENGEFITVEMPYEFEAGQLQGEDFYGKSFAADLLEDGNIVLSVFYPGEDDSVVCLSLFLEHPAE